MEDSDRRYITLLMHSSHLRQIWWTLLHATCDSSPGRKIHTKYSLQHSERLGSPQYTIWVYMDRDGWIKEMMHFKSVCGSNNINSIVLFYDDHYSHFEDRAIHILRSHHIKPFILKAGDSGNGHPNDDVPNLKMRQ